MRTKKITRLQFDYQQLKQVAQRYQRKLPPSVEVMESYQICSIKKLTFYEIRVDTFSLFPHNNDIQMIRCR